MCHSRHRIISCVTMVFDRHWNYLRDAKFYYNIGTGYTILFKLKGDHYLLTKNETSKSVDRCRSVIAKHTSGFKIKFKNATCTHAHTYIYLWDGNKT